ncbi:MAG: tetratricopeptide repeat protein [Pirellulaceae bacterium]
MRNIRLVVGRLCCVHSRAIGYRKVPDLEIAYIRRVGGNVVIRFLNCEAIISNDARYRSSFGEEMLNARACRWLRPALFMLLVGLCATLRGQEQLTEGLASLADGAYEKAADVLGEFVRKNPQHPSVAQAMCGAGQALAAIGRHGEALEHFHNALKHPNHRLRVAPIELACARSAMALDQYDVAIGHATEAIKQSDDIRHRAAAHPMLIAALCKAERVSEAWAHFISVASAKELPLSTLSLLARQVGADALNRGEAATACEAFRWQQENDQDVDSKQTAALGYAWAQSALATDPEEAAEAFLTFIEQYPKAAGAPRAMLAAARKRIEAEQIDQAMRLLQRVADDYPDADEASESLSLLIQLARQTEDIDRERKARDQLAVQHVGSPAARSVLHVALIEAAKSTDASQFKAISSSILNTGEPLLVRQTLDRLDETSGNEVVLRFADVGLQRMIDPQQTPTTSVIVDWLFEHKQWSLITEAAAKMPTDVLLADIHQATVIAESYHRLGSIEASLDLFDRLAAQPKAGFVIFLRRAELAVQIRTLENAEQAIEEASRQATSSRDKQYVQIVAAQLSIRKANFDAARKQLETVVLSPTADQRLRGRAQWLVGETYFMQRNFNAAIDAYRRCETLFPESGWSAAAMLQAGKAFEKLGNFRDAAVCYTNLLNQHGSSPYAQLASQRLGWIGKDKLR